MKLKNILFCLFVFVFMDVQISAQETDPVVTNVAFSISGTTVTVTYNVSDAEQSTVTISMFVSNNGGTTWDYNYGTASGDIGIGISVGTGKTITWTYSGGLANNFKIEIVANDEAAGGSPCTGTPTVTYAGTTYNTIQIGNQCWLKENLDVGTMIQGSANQTDNSTIEKYCYNNDPANCTTYGGLYQWNEAMQYSAINSGEQGICPPNWHIPTSAEQQTLSDIVNRSGNALKAIGQGTGVGTGTNTSGFAGLFGGYLYSGTFYSLGYSTPFWSSDFGFHLSLYGDNDSAGLLSNTPDYGFSVRCLED